MASSKTRSSGRQQKGQASSNEVPTTGAEKVTPATSGLGPEQNPELGSHVGNDETMSAQGPDDRRGVFDSQGGGALGAERESRSRSNSLDNGARPNDMSTSRNTNNSAIKDAHLVVSETKDMVHALMNRLTRLEQALGLNEMSNVTNSVTQEEETPAPEAGPSKSKGKSIDPRNWGNIDRPEKEIDPEMQRIIFEQAKNARFEQNSDDDDEDDGDDDELRRLKELERLYSEAKEMYSQKMRYKREHNNRISGTPMSDDVEALISQAARRRVQAKKGDAIRPSNQLPPESLLGQFFHKPRSTPVPQQIGPLDSGGNNTVSTVRFKPLAPTTPDKYNGDADFMRFYKYITQCERFCEEAALPPRDQVVKCADYLTGKAYKFYSTVISISAESWDRQRFFTELYNYCFPPDFRLRQRKKLESFSQGDMTVAEFAAELMILFRIIGKSTAEQRVDRLWNGLRPELQSALWKEGLDYEQNTWDEVIQVATRYEIAEQIENNQRKDQRNNKGNNNSGARRNNNNNYRQQNTDNNGTRREHRNEDGAPKNSKFETSKNSNNKSTDQNQAAARPNEANSQVECYRCKGFGHISRNCPSAQTVKSKNNHGKPPGVKSFNIEVAVENEDMLAALESTTEQAVADSHCMEVTMSMCGILDNNDINTDTAQNTFSIEEGVRKLYDPTSGDYLDGTLRNPVCELVEHQLEAMRPYPGDPSWERRMINRFHVYATHGGQKLVILDTISDDDELILDVGMVFRPKFLIGRWYAIKRTQATRICVKPLPRWHRRTPILNWWTENVAWKLSTGGKSFRKYLESPKSARRRQMERFGVYYSTEEDPEYCTVIDWATRLHFKLSIRNIENPRFNVRHWYYKQLVKYFKFRFSELTGYIPDRPLECLFGSQRQEGETRDNNKTEDLDYAYSSDKENIVELNSQEPQENIIPSAQRNSARVKDPSRVVPDPIIIVVNIAGRPARALIDTGSLCDFMSSTLADQLKLKREELATPLIVQLAVLGSRSKVNYRTNAEFSYQGIKESRRFDIINLSSYDLILGTPFIYQHKVLVGLNPTRVIIGCNEALPIKGSAVRTLQSRAARLREENLDEVREYLKGKAAPLCKTAAETPLPPLRAINHKIDLIDDDLQYPYRPARCPQPLMKQWIEKRNAYIGSGRWEITNSRNTVPMMFIPKPGKPGEELRLRTVKDLRPRNANTHKLISPLPDIDGIMRRVASKPYRSLIDLKDAYEQVRIEPGDVWKTAFNTPNGNMVSHVIQIGDCNAPATFQSLMNHIFSSYIGKFMDAYLDDIVIYSDTLEDHIKHVEKVLEILEKEKFYLSANKLDFLCKRVKILGRIVDEDGIQMDPHKVDALLNWKTPTNRELLRGFLGAASYLADDIESVRIPMGILHTLTSKEVPFRWEHIHQRAFEEIKERANRCRDHHRRPINYSEGAPPINVITDASISGIAGVISQGEDWKTAKVAAFYSAKLTPAQQNYPVHEAEMLAGLETMMRYRDLLLGVKFRWYTDHKGLVTVLTHRDIDRASSGRRARWLEQLSMFNFEVIYVPGTENILSDALSRIYSNDAPGTVRAASEYTEYDEPENGTTMQDAMEVIAAPVLVGIEAACTAIAEDIGLSAVGEINPNFVGRRSKKARERPGAETGRPETAEEFAARVKDSFVIKGPKQVQEGASTSSTSRERLVIRLPARKKTSNADQQPQEEINRSEPVDNQQQHDVDEQLNMIPLDLYVNRDGVSIINEIKGRYDEDSMFKSIVESPNEYKNFEYDQKNKLLYLKQDNNKLLCIPDIKINDSSARGLVISEGHSLLAHLSSRKTYNYLREHVWWKTLAKDIEIFCDSCSICKRTKDSHTKSYGLLNPLELSRRPWDAIGIDFVGPLPTSDNRDGSFDMIVVIIDLFSGMVHLVPGRTDYKAKDIAELIFSEVYKHHGLPSSIVSDRDKWFTSHFWEELHKLIGTKLRMSSAYHPQTDGATERANKTISQMLRNCVSPNQKDWVIKLPAIEFAINSARSESTGFAPFFLNTGRMPRSFIWPSDKPSEYPGVRMFARRMKSAIMQAHDSLIASRVKSIRNANRKRVRAPFNKEDFVYISTRNISIPKGLSQKLAPRFIGPYKIIEDFGNNSYRINLPPSLRKRGVHDVFHASLLRIHVPNDDRLFPGRLDTQIFDDEDLEGEWAVQRILSHHGEGMNTIFKILWKSGDKSWLPYTEIKHLHEFDEYLDAKGAKTISELSREVQDDAPDDPQLCLGNIEIFIEPENSEYKRRNALGGINVNYSFTSQPHCSQLMINAMSTTGATSLNHSELSNNFRNLGINTPANSSSPVSGLEEPQISTITENSQPLTTEPSGQPMSCANNTTGEQDVAMPDAMVNQLLTLTAIPQTHGRDHFGRIFKLPILVHGTAVLFQLDTFRYAILDPAGVAHHLHAVQLKSYIQFSARGQKPTNQPTFKPIGYDEFLSYLHQDETNPNLRLTVFDDNGNVISAPPPGRFPLVVYCPDDTQMRNAMMMNEIYPHTRQMSKINNIIISKAAEASHSRAKHFKKKNKF